MSKFKKCKICGCTLDKNNKIKIKSARNFGEINRKINLNSGAEAYIRERATVIFICKECFKFETQNNDVEDKGFFSIPESKTISNLLNQKAGKSQKVYSGSGKL